MTTQTIDFRQSRTFDEVLRATFAFPRIMLKPLLRSIVFVAGIPTLIVVVSAFGIGLLFIQNNGFVGMWESLGKFDISVMVLLGIVFVVVAMLPYVLFHASITAFVLLYAQYGNQPPTSVEVWNYVRQHAAQFVSTGVFTALIVTLAFLLFVLPGIYISIALWMVYIVRLQEKLDMADAFGRCLHLVKGYWWQTFAITVVLSLFVFVVQHGVAFFLDVIGSLELAALMGAIPAAVLLAMLQAVSPVVVALAYIPLIIAPAIQYYNLVERKEAVGLQEKILSMTNKEEQERGEL